MCAGETGMLGEEGGAEDYNDDDLQDIVEDGLDEV